MKQTLDVNNGLCLVITCYMYSNDVIAVLGATQSGCLNQQRMFYGKVVVPGIDGC